MASGRTGDAGIESRSAGLDAAIVALLAGLMACRTMVSWTPLVHFDIDPSAVSREAVIPFAGFGPCGSLAVDALTLIVAALLSWRTAARRWGWLPMLLLAGAVMAAIDLVAVLRGDFEDLWRGSAWVSAIIGATALASCASHPRAPMLQRVAITVVLGVSVAWIAKGSLQLAIEHDRTVAQFEATRAEFFAAQGWDAGSPQALTYERRLMQREATGWFGLSNVMAGLCAAVAVAAAMLAWSARRVVTLLQEAGLVLLALGAAAVVAANGSKGAVAACLIGGVAAILAHRSSWHARLALVAAMSVPVVAVLVRGALGGALGEQSLLFRSQYWQGAAQVAAEAWPWGSGPDAFQALYTRARPPLAVEEVTSAHAAPVDWIATLGIAGVIVTAGWIALVLHAGARSDAVDPERSEATPPGSLRDEWSAVIPGLVAAALASAAADPDGRGLPIVGIMLAAWIAFGILAGLRAVGERAVRAVMVGAVGVLACHAMIEMTLWQPGSASWVFGVAGAAAMGMASSSCMGEGMSRLVARGGAVIVLAMALGDALLARSTWTQERIVESAAETLVENLFTPPARAKAGELLSTAHDEHDGLRRHLLLARAADQWLQAALAEPDPARARVWFDEARANAERCAASMPLRGRLLEAAIVQAMAERGLLEWSVVVDLGLRVLEADPRQTNTMVRMADAFTRQSDPASAAEWARRAIETDDSFRMDPLRQLPAQVRARCLAMTR